MNKVLSDLMQTQAWDDLVAALKRLWQALKDAGYLDWAVYLLRRVTAAA